MGRKKKIVDEQVEDDTKIQNDEKEFKLTHIIFEKEPEKDTLTITNLFQEIINSKIDRYNKFRKLEDDTGISNEVTKLENDIIDLSLKDYYILHPDKKENFNKKENEEFDKMKNSFRKTLGKLGDRPPVDD